MGVAPTASGQAALRSDFEGQNQSHASLSLLFAVFMESEAPNVTKRNACFAFESEQA